MKQDEINRAPWSILQFPMLRPDTDRNRFARSPGVRFQGRLNAPRPSKSQDIPLPVAPAVLAVRKFICGGRNRTDERCESRPCSIQLLILRIPARIFPFFFAVLSPKISRAKALVRFSRCRAPRGRLSRKIGSKQIAIGWWTASQACERCELEGNFQVEGHSNCTLGKCHNS